MIFIHNNASWNIKIKCEHTEAERRNCRKFKQDIAMNHFSLWNVVTGVTYYALLPCLRKNEVSNFYYICMLMDSCYRYSVTVMSK